MIDVPQNELYRPLTLAKRIVFVDGLMGAGKSTVCGILASLRNVEIEQIEPLFENVGALFLMGKIEPFAARALLRRRVDERIYDAYICRNLNFRWKDKSSIFRNGRPWRYLARLLHPEGERNVAALLADRPIFQCHTHDQMAAIDLHFDTWPEELQVIELRRHPVDLIHDWHRRGWGARFDNDPRSFEFCIRVGDEAVPYYARDWGSEYGQMTPMERVTRVIHQLCLTNRATYEALIRERKKRIFVQRFDEFLAFSYRCAEEMAAFLETEVARHTRYAVRRAGCPRTISTSEREEKRKEIQEGVGVAGRTQLDELIAEYETEWK